MGFMGERGMTIAEAITLLSKMPPNAPLYFDCNHCGRGMRILSVGEVVLVKTKPPNEEIKP
jgi:hypothetical protein